MPMQALAAFHDFHPKPENFHDAVVEGLSKPCKTLPFEFFYDAEGSRLFDACSSESGAPGEAWFSLAT